MLAQGQDYNAGYRRAVEDIEEILHDACHRLNADAEVSVYDAISTAEYTDLAAYSREFQDGYHDALQKLYNIFKKQAATRGYESGYKQALEDIAQSEDNSIMIRSTEVLDGSIVIDCFQLVPYNIEFAETGSISGRDIEIFAKAFNLNVTATEAEDDFTTLTVSNAAAFIDEDTDAYTGRVFKV